MLGLLGGLLSGGARLAAGGAAGRAMGGSALGGLLNRARSAPMQSASSAPAPVANKDAPMQAEAQEQSGQSKAPEQATQPAQQPYQQPLVANTADKIEQPAMQEKAEKASPLAGLADDAPAAPEPMKKPDEPVAQPQQVVNKTPTMTPVARPVQEQVGQTPQMRMTDVLQNQLMDSGTNRQVAEYQDGNPSQPVDLGKQEYTADQGYRYVGPTTVGGAMPSRMYRMRG
jgi:hypothetical protein